MARRDHGLGPGRVVHMRRAREAAAQRLREPGRPPRLRERLARLPARIQRPSGRRLPRRRPRQGPGRDDGLPARPHPHRLQHPVRALRPDRIQPGARGPRGRHHRGRSRPLSRSPDAGPRGHPRAVRDADDDRIGRARPQADPERDRRPARLRGRLSRPGRRHRQRPRLPRLGRPGRGMRLAGPPGKKGRRHPLRGSLLHALFLHRGYLPDIARRGGPGQGSRSSIPTSISSGA